MHKWKPLDTHYTLPALLIGCTICKFIHLRRTICKALRLPHRRWTSRGYNRLHIIGE